jgi:hypothetical protein
MALPNHCRTLLDLASTWFGQHAWDAVRWLLRAIRLSRLSSDWLNADGMSTPPCFSHLGKYDRCTRPPSSCFGGSRISHACVVEALVHKLLLPKGMHVSPVQRNSLGGGRRNVWSDASNLNGFYKMLGGAILKSNMLITHWLVT